MAESRSSNKNKGVGVLGSTGKVSTKSLCPSSKEVIWVDVRWVQGTQGVPWQQLAWGAEHQSWSLLMGVTWGGAGEVFWRLKTRPMVGVFYFIYFIFRVF